MTRCGARENPRYPSVYVGQSVRPPRERLEQHKRGYRASRVVKKHGRVAALAALREVQPAPEPTGRGGGGTRAGEPPPKEGIHRLRRALSNRSRETRTSSWRPRPPPRYGFDPHWGGRSCPAPGTRRSSGSTSPRADSCRRRSSPRAPYSSRTGWSSGPCCTRSSSRPVSSAPRRRDSSSLRR